MSTSNKFCKKKDQEISHNISHCDLAYDITETPMNVFQFSTETTPGKQSVTRTDSRSSSKKDEPKKKGLSGKTLPILISYILTFSYSSQKA